MNNQKEFKTEILGNVCIENLTDEQQHNFYITLFARILELYKQKLEKESEEV